MKILFSHFSTYQGRGWNRTYMLAKYIAALGNEVLILTTSNKPSIIFYKSAYLDNVKVIIVADIFPKKVRVLGLSPFNLVLRIFFVIFNKFNIVHADSGHRPVAGIPCRINRMIYKSKYFSEWWDYFGKGGQYDNKPFFWKMTYGYIDNFLEKRDKISADGVIVLSKFLMQKALSLNIPQKRIKLIHGGVDIEHISFSINSTARKIFNIPKTSFVISFVGANKSELSDLIPLFYAIEEIKNIYDILFVTTGEKNILKNILEKINVSFPFREYGYLKYGHDYSLFLSCSNVFVLIMENNIRNKSRWPNKIGDYFAAGRPILLSRVGDIDEFIEKFPRIFIETNNSKENIKEKLIYLINEKKINYKKIRDLSKQYSWEQKAKSLYHFYKDVK